MKIEIKRNNMENYIGKKIIGFKFQNGTDCISWNEYISNHIGRIGEIILQNESSVRVEFKNGTCNYPISLIEQHLVNEEPKIPQLGEGVLMQVSDSGTNWSRAYIIAKFANDRFLDTNRLFWNYAKPIEKQLPKYTHAELVEKLGEDFEYVK
jgi:hypothetical protein